MSPRWGVFCALTSATAIAVIGIVACNLTDGLQGGADEDASDGSSLESSTSCDADLASSIESCGACGHACAAGPNSVASCVDGGCTVVCTSPAFADCDEDASTGCEANLNNARTHCGKCGHDCLGGACTAGECQPYLLAAGAEAPAQIVDDDAFLYGINAFGSVTRIRKDGGTNSYNVLASGGATSQSPPPRIAIGGGSLYWTTYSGVAADGGADGGIYELLLDAGSGAKPSVLTTADRPLAISVNATTAFWSEGPTSGPGASGTIKSCRLSAGVGCGKTNVVVPVETGAITSVIVQGQNVYWANGGTAPGFGDGAVRKCPWATLPCAPEDLATSPIRAFALTIDGNTAYWTARESVASCLLVGCSKQAMIVDNFQLDPFFLTATNQTVFFTTRDGAIKSIPKAGPPTAEKILFQQRGTNPWDVVVDTQAVYWTDLSGKPGTPGTAVYKLAR